MILNLMELAIPFLPASVISALLLGFIAEVRADATYIIILGIIFLGFKFWKFRHGAEIAVGNWLIGAVFILAPTALMIFLPAPQ